MPPLLSRRGERGDRDTGIESLSVLRPLLAFLVAATAIAFGFSASAGATPTANHARARADRLMVHDLLVEINVLRASHSLRPVRLSPSLRRAADQHDREMGRLGYFSHDSADGADFLGRIEHYYPSGGARYWMVGENLLWSARNLTAKAALRVWMHSPLHRANLLRSNWRQIGVSAHRYASARGYFHRRSIWLVTTDFGVRY